MELSKKTTILFTPELHDRLIRIAAQRGTSLGDLVRSACERVYLSPSQQERVVAVDALAALRLPVGEVRDMKRESVPDSHHLMP